MVCAVNSVDIIIIMMTIVHSAMSSEYMRVASSMNCPPNPRAAEFALAYREYYEQTVYAERVYLTWPACDPAVFVVAEQWHRNAQGEIEAWYTRGELAECVRMMEKARGNLA